MEINETNLQQLAGYLQQTLSPDPNVRRPVEKLMESIAIQRNYAVLLLHLIDKQEVDMTIRVAGAIAFKNYIKRNWEANEDTDGPDKIHEDDRKTIKTLILTLMLRSPSALQKQLSDAVSIIGIQLIDEMVEKFATGDFNVINGVLQTAHSLFKRYHCELKSQALWEEMKLVLDRMAKPLTDLLLATMQLAKVHENNTEALKVIYGSLVLVCKVFLSLNSQDLPEFFEDNMPTWMKAFHKLLTVDVPCLHTGDDEDAGVLEHLRSQICENIGLYAQKNYEEFGTYRETFVTAVWELLVKTGIQTKYDAAFHKLLTVDVPCLHTGDDEDAGVLEHLRSQICENIGLYAQKNYEKFGTYRETFVTAVWELLVKTGIQTKYDALVSNALKFLSVVAERSHYRKIFKNPEILANICKKVVIPNLDFRQSDEELFEDSPEEYIRRDIEGFDIDTRRPAACDLVKTLSKNFEAKIFAIFGQYLEILLSKYNENPATNWRAKDTAIYLVTSLASRGDTQKHGITHASELVPLPQFCAQHIIPELERPNINELPVLKSAAIKFIMVFRSLLGTQTLLGCIPHLIRHMPAESVVVHSYAACAIEKVLVMRDSNQQLVITAQHLGPFTNDLLSGLFATLSLAGSGENEYVMKAIMRSFSTLQEATMPYMAVALPRLTEILTLVAKNPSRPHFNHYLFETLSLAIKIVCKTESAAVSSFEEALFPVFQGILQQDILEFMPYVFQMLSLLLEIREGSGSIPEPYWALFPCLLVPALWDRPGNVTPLIRLITAFIRQGSAQIVPLGKLNAVLGIFQKMIASKSNDHEGFYLMQNLLAYYPADQLLQPNMRQIFELLFQRLSLSKTTKYVRGIIVFLCYYTAKMGAPALVELIDQIQANMFGMLIERVFIPDMAKVTAEMDRKIVAVGVAKILTDCPSMLTPTYVQRWAPLLQALVELFELPPDQTTLDGDHFVEVDDAPGYQAAFSQLSYAQPKSQDFLKDITDGRKYLAESLSKLSQTRPGELPTLMATIGDNHKQALQKYCDQAGVRIV